MYYQSIAHHTVECTNAEDAAMRILSGAALSFEALVWKSSVNGQRLAAVADGGLDNPWSEVAVINLDTNRQIESITFGWIMADEKAGEVATDYLQNCETSTIDMGPANLPLDNAGEDKTTTFTCACCGEGFQSTIAIQKPRDQDEGYGHCPECIKRFQLQPA